MRHSVLLGLLLASSSVFAQTTTQPPTGRLLASNCFQCHGTDGSGGFERLAGMSSSEIVSELREMRTKSNPDIMEVHARGFTDAQLQLIGNYFASLRSTSSTSTSSLSTFRTSLSTETDDHDD